MDKKTKETWDSRFIYQKQLDKAWFQQDISCGYFKDLNRRTIADKALCNKAFNFAKNSKYDECQRGLASIVYIFFWWKNFRWSYWKINYAKWRFS